MPKPDLGTAQQAVVRLLLTLNHVDGPAPLNSPPRQPEVTLAAFNSPDGWLSETAPSGCSVTSPQGWSSGRRFM